MRTKGRMWTRERESKRERERDKEVQKRRPSQRMTKWLIVEAMKDKRAGSWCSASIQLVCTVSNIIYASSHTSIPNPIQAHAHAHNHAHAAVHRHTHTRTHVHSLNRSVAFVSSSQWLCCLLCLASACKHYLPCESMVGACACSGGVFVMMRKA